MLCYTVMTRGIRSRGTGICSVTEHRASRMLVSAEVHVYLREGNIPEHCHQSCTPAPLPEPVQYYRSTSRSPTSSGTCIIVILSQGIVMTMTSASRTFAVTALPIVYIRGVLVLEHLLPYALLCVRAALRARSGEPPSKKTHWETWKASTSFRNS